MQYLEFAAAVVALAFIVIVPPIVADLLAKRCRTKFALCMLGGFFSTCAYILWVYFIMTCLGSDGFKVIALLAAIGTTRATSIISGTKIK